LFFLHFALHLESAYDAFRAHCKRIDYQGEVVDLKALRRLITENKKQTGFVVSESERVAFDGRDSRRRAVLIDLAKTPAITADDFPQTEGSERATFSQSHAGRAPWNEPS
jgi:hypothetical protein